MTWLFKRKNILSRGGFASLAKFRDRRSLCLSLWWFAKQSDLVLSLVLSAGKNFHLFSGGENAIKVSRRNANVQQGRASGDAISVIRGKFSVWFDMHILGPKCVEEFPEYIDFVVEELEFCGIFEIIVRIDAGASDDVGIGAVEVFVA